MLLISEHRCNLFIHCLHSLVLKNSDLGRVDYVIWILTGNRSCDMTQCTALILKPCFTFRLLDWFIFRGIFHVLQFFSVTVCD